MARYTKWLVPAGAVAGLLYYFSDGDEKHPPPSAALPALHTHFDAATDAAGHLYIVKHRDLSATRGNKAFDNCVADHGGKQEDCLSLTPTQRQFGGKSDIENGVVVCAGVSVHGAWPHVGAVFSGGATLKDALNDMARRCAHGGSCTSSSAAVMCNHDDAFDYTRFDLPTPGGVR